MRVKVEKEEHVERIVIDVAAGRVRLEGDMPEPLLDIELDKALLEAVKKWLKSQRDIKKVQDE